MATIHFVVGLFPAISKSRCNHIREKSYDLKLVTVVLYGPKYSRMKQAKFVEDSLYTNILHKYITQINNKYIYIKNIECMYCINYTKSRLTETGCFSRISKLVKLRKQNKKNRNQTKNLKTKKKTVIVLIEVIIFF